MKQAGIREIVFTNPGMGSEVVESYLKGDLAISSQQFCRCSH